MNSEGKAVTAVLAKYEKALNDSDTDAVMKLYASDGVFMAQNFPSSVGADAVRKAYDMVFKTIKLSVNFNVAEVVQVAPQWAFARTNSAGNVTVNTTGAKSAEANQELECSTRLMWHGKSRDTVSLPLIHLANKAAKPKGRKHGHYKSGNHGHNASCGDPRARGS